MELKRGDWHTVNVNGKTYYLDFFQTDDGNLGISAYNKIPNIDGDTDDRPQKFDDFFTNF